MYINPMGTAHTQPTTPQTSHAPGPWAVESTLPPNGRGVIARVGSEAISAPVDETYDYVGHARANALLIAAAPELLAAAKVATSSLEWGPSYELLTTAIARAEGRL